MPFIIIPVGINIICALVNLGMKWAEGDIYIGKDEKPKECEKKWMKNSEEIEVDENLKRYFNNKE